MICKELFIYQLYETLKLSKHLAVSFKMFETRYNFLTNIWIHQKSHLNCFSYLKDWQLTKKQRINSCFRCFCKQYHCFWSKSWSVRKILAIMQWSVISRVTSDNTPMFSTEGHILEQLLPSLRLKNKWLEYQF